MSQSYIRDLNILAGYVVYTENDLPLPSPALYEEASPSGSIFVHHSPAAVNHPHTAPEGNGRGQGMDTNWLESSGVGLIHASLPASCTAQFSLLAI